MWQHLAPALAALGWHTTVCARAWPGQAMQERDAGVHYQRWGGFAQHPGTLRNLLRDVPYAWGLARRLPQADALIVNDAVLPRLAPAHAGRIVVSVNRYPKAGQAWLWQRAAALVAPSQAIARAIALRAPELAARVVVIGNALPLHRFAPEPQRADRHALLYVGRLHPEKGVDLAISAVLRLRARGVPLRLTVVGPHAADAGGGGDAYRRTLLALAGDDPAIRFHGPEFDPAALRALYAGHGVFLYPSRAEFGEALPVAPLEAMATGCLPVVSSLACFDDYLVHGQTGWRCAAAPTDPLDALVDVLQEACAAPEASLAVMRAQARAMALRFDIGPIAAAWSECLQRVLATAGPTA